MAAIGGLWENTRRITKLVWRERKWLMIGLTVLIFVIAAGPSLQSGVRGLLVNELVRIAGGGAALSQTLILLVALLVGASVLAAAFAPLYEYLDRKFWFFLEEKFELLVLRKYSEADVAIHESPKRNDLFQRVTEYGTWRIRDFADRQFFILQNVLEIGLASAILVSAKWWLFLVVLIASVPEFIIEVQHGQRLWGIFMGRTEVRRRYWDLRRHFQFLPEIVELKIFQSTEHFLGIIRKLVRSFHDQQLKNDRRKLWGEFAALGFGQAGIAFAVIWFVARVVQGELQVGTLTFLLASIGNLRQAFSAFFMNVGRQYQDSLFVSDVFELLDMPSVVEKPKKAIALSRQGTPEIVFDKVTFAYPGTGKIVLKDFSLKIPPGEKIALVGSNGAGKTTLIKLLCRFYDPDKGKVLIDGHDLREIDLESWYQELGVLFQDYANYHFIVREAIAAGRTGEEKEHALEKVKAAAKASEADVFIKEWEKEYEQMLGKGFTGGVEPSIGEWQKLALARTFYRDPRIFILDEPTSSIDAESEAKIFEKLEQLPKDRTVILISHRFSTVRQANRICVIEDGHPAELGTHEELLKLNGTYARLFRLQARGYR